MSREMPRCRALSALNTVSETDLGLAGFPAWQERADAQIGRWQESAIEGSK